MSDYSDSDSEYSYKEEVGGIDEVVPAVEAPAESDDEELVLSDIDADDLVVEGEAKAEASDEEEEDEGEDPEQVAVEDNTSTTDIIIIKDENRRMSNVLTKYEMTELITVRGTQIAEHNNCFVKNDYDDPIKQAKLELMSRKCPCAILRKAGEVRNAAGNIDKLYERWVPNDMTFSVVYDV